MELPFDPVIPQLGIHPKNPESTIQKNLCTPMFIEILFTIAESWKQPECPSVKEWMEKTVVYLRSVILASERRNSYLLQQHGWNWRALC